MGILPSGGAQITDGDFEVASPSGCLGAEAELKALVGSVRLGNRANNMQGLVLGFWKAKGAMIGQEQG